MPTSPPTRALLRLRLALAALALLLLAPAGAAAQTVGGSSYSDDPIARTFAVKPSTTIVAGGAPTTFAWQVVGGEGPLRIRVAFVPAGSRKVALTADLGTATPGAKRSRRVKVPASLPGGRYTARLHAVDKDGDPLKRGSRTPGKVNVDVKPAGPAAPTTAPGTVRFPVQGRFTWGDGLGAGRNHQGQDLMAASGTPVVSPGAGTVVFNQYQASGAGHYLVVRDPANGVDYVSMHLREPSPLKVGTKVAVGQQIGVVGSTGRSTAPHLHFEVWSSPWQQGGSHKDPRPLLNAWLASAPGAARAQG